MWIEKVILKNYRQFKDIEISFRRQSDRHNLYILIGVMGTGKTNFLNAINWCLYNDEPYVSRESQQLPIINIKSIIEANYGEDKEVIVEVWVQTPDNRRIIFTRKEIFRIYNQNEIPQKRDVLFEVKLSDDQRNIKIVEDEEAKELVERFVPKNIREFFFFDGERLDRYFREATGQHVRHAISVISQVDLIEKVSDRIETIRKELEKEASRVNPQIEQIRQNIEECEKKQEAIIEQIKDCQEQIAISREKVREYEENLRNLPNIEELENERKKLHSQKKDKNFQLSEKIKNKQDLLYEYGLIIFMWPAISEAIRIIKEKRDKREIPPTIDRGLLENIVKNNFCNICGQKINEEAKKKIESLLDEIKLSSEVSQRLLSIENPLILYADKIKRFKKDIEKVIAEITEYERDLKDIDDRIDKIDKQLSGYEIEKIREWHEERRKFEEIYDKNQQKLGILNNQKQELEEKLKIYRDSFNKELKKGEELEKIKRKIDFCMKALNVLKETKEKIMNDIRNDIESRTKRYFFDLIWKKDSFRDITIEENYNINLIHSMGYDCLGSISGGEREVLTLAFTMALHEISGFDSPIVIDRPFAMVSGDSKKNIVNVLSQISTKKQVVLFFTTDDYSHDVSNILDACASQRYKLYMTADEKETRVEVL